MNHELASGKIKALVIGGSAGAVGALLAILPPLPRDYPLAVMVVVHLPPDPNSILATLLHGRCQIPVKEAEDKEPICAGTVYLAPPNYHLQVEPDFHLSLSQDEPVHFSRPSIDVLFETAADAYGDSLAGVVLTGASRDGARGLRAIGEAGGVVIVQTPASAEAATMPQAALDACPAARTLDLPELAAALQTDLVSAPT
ncbi:two-component system chemotaxis response regulator CheB [Prosthecobacter fusiformis]|uniref:protein-glutamate methylesterase n=1 Tax=Prosthecobacter fusiformis TaxID=48464 RepID=A0A4R7S1L8_9BACT|nr:chemotaxis protein CheB [Prosthecobacter fusiformis]TDU71308.1 two-component system chemotaxis response regulator CheB [Prosthecobacter fusiformis]